MDAICEMLEISSIYLYALLLSDRLVTTQPGDPTGSDPNPTQSPDWVRIAKKSQSPRGSQITKISGLNDPRYIFNIGGDIGGWLGPEESDC